MIHIILAALLFSIPVLHAQSPTFIPTGYQPLFMHLSDDTMHVFCNGIDIDYDNIYEPANGEVPASWFKYHAKTRNLISRKDIGHMYFTSPLRPAFGSNRMYNPKGNVIEVYDITTQELIDSAIIALPSPSAIIRGVFAHSVKLDGGAEKNILAFTHKTSFTQPGFFSLYDMDEKRIIAETEVGINPQMILSFVNLQGETEYLVLSEGGFGGNNSTIHRLLPTPNSGLPFQSTELDLGDTGNFFAIQGQLALAVMNGSHEIIPINLATNTVLPGYPTGTSLYDGPREIVIDTLTNRVFISTFASDIRIGALFNTGILGNLDPNGKPEGMALVGGSLWVGNAYKKGDYAPDSTIAIFPIGTTSIYEERMSAESIMLKDGICTIRMNDDSSPAEVYVMDAKGKMVKSYTISTKEHQFSMQDLSQGIYGVYVHSRVGTSHALLLHMK